VSGGIARLERDGPALDVAEVTHLLLERGPPFQPLPGVEEADNGRLPGWLGVRLERSDDDEAEGQERNEYAIDENARGAL
jgi:hypothetical protein